MSTEWRLLQDGIHQARHHFAMEEALVRLLDAGQSPPTLRLRQVEPAVFVGAFQNTWQEVDLDYCQSHQIQIVRRANGGGAVYQEMGSFCFSAFFRRNFFDLSDDELYHLFAKPVIRTCADYGVEASLQGRNDVLAGGRKIFGSAQLSWYSAFIQSGTFLVNMDFERMQRALTPPALKFAGKDARSIRERVTSLSQQAGREIETGEVMERFANHATEVLGIRLVAGELSNEELSLAAELLRSKYDTDAWNLGGRKEYQVTVAERTQAGVISLSADLQGEIILQARFSGDLLLSDRNALDRLVTLLPGCLLKEASAVVQSADLPAGLREGMLGLLAKLAAETAVQNH